MTSTKQHSTVCTLTCLYGNTTEPQVLPALAAHAPHGLQPEGLPDLTCQLTPHKPAPSRRLDASGSLVRKQLA